MLRTIRMLRGISFSALIIHVAVLCTTFAASSDTVIVFRGGQTVVPYTQNDNVTVIERKPVAFRAPAFVGSMLFGKELLVALCDARYLHWSDWNPIEIASKISYGDHAKWEPAAIVAKNTRKGDKSLVGDPTAVIKGNKVYALVVSWDHSPHSWVWHDDRAGWNPYMYIGTVTNTSDNMSVFVQWAAPVSLRHLLPASVNGAAGKQFVGGVGNGVVMSDGTIVLPIQMANVNRQVMASIIYSKDDGVTWAMGGATYNGPSEASIVEWSKGALLLTARVDDRPRQMFLSNDMGNTWTEFTSLSGVWGNQPNRGGPGCQASLIKVSVEGTDVLLLSHPLNTKGRYIRDRLQLWMSDGHRVFHVGEISKPKEGERSGYAILAYVGEHLYCMHEINPFDPHYRNPPLVGWDRTLALNELSSMMDIVKAKVRSWKQLDGKLESSGIPTDGLIGYLSNSTNGAAWADAYGCVDAVVRNAERVEGGFQFPGASQAGRGEARWPVSAQGQNQRYYSTRWAFTLAATVSISSLAENGESAVLGASVDMTGKNVLLGLGFASNKKWFVVHSGSQKVEDIGSFGLDREYRVALTYLQGAVSVFVDGALLHSRRLHGTRADIAYFYMGGHGQTAQNNGSRNTVKNVMLYNRALNKDQIKLLYKYAKIRTASATLIDSITATSTILCSKSITDSQTHQKTTTYTVASATISSEVALRKDDSTVNQLTQVHVVLNTSKLDPVNSDFNVSNITTDDGYVRVDSNSSVPAFAKASSNSSSLSHKRFTPSVSQVEKGAGTEQQGEGDCATLVTVHMVAVL